MFQINRNQVVEAATLLQNAKESALENAETMENEKGALVAATLRFEASKSDDLVGTFKEIWIGFGGKGDWADVETGLNSGLIEIEDLIVGFRQNMAISAE